MTVTAWRHDAASLELAKRKKINIERKKKMTMRTFE